MGQKGSESLLRKKGNKKIGMDIPPDSPLGIKLANWEEDLPTKGLDKIKMIQYCMIEWTKEEIR